MPEQSSIEDNKITQGNYDRIPTLMGGLKWDDKFVGQVHDANMVYLIVDRGRELIKADSAKLIDLYQAHGNRYHDAGIIKDRILNRLPLITVTETIPTLHLTEASLKRTPQIMHERLKQPGEKLEKNTPAKEEIFKAEKEYFEALDAIYGQKGGGLCVLTNKPCCDPKTGKCGAWVDFVCNYKDLHGHPTVCFRHAEGSQAWKDAWDIINANKAFETELNEYVQKVNELFEYSARMENIKAEIDKSEKEKKNIFPQGDFNSLRRFQEINTHIEALHKELEDHHFKELQELNIKIGNLRRALENPDAVATLKKANDYILSPGAAPLCLQEIKDPATMQVRACHYSQPLFEVTAQVDPLEEFVNLAKTEYKDYPLSQNKMVSITSIRYPKTARTTPATMDQPGLHSSVHWQCVWGPYPCYSVTEVTMLDQKTNKFKTLLIGDYVWMQVGAKAGKAIQPFLRLAARAIQASTRELSAAIKEHEEFIAHAGTSAMGGSAMTSKAGIGGEYRGGGATGTPIDKEVRQYKKDMEEGLVDFNLIPEKGPNPNNPTGKWYEYIDVKYRQYDTGIRKTLRVDVSDIWEYTDPVTRETKLSQVSLNKLKRLGLKRSGQFADRFKKEEDRIFQALLQEEGGKKMIEEMNKQREEAAQLLKTMEQPEK